MRHPIAEFREQISVRTNRYSVPVRLIGRTARAMLHASELVVYDGQLEVARHERLIAKGQARLDLGPPSGSPGPQARSVPRCRRAQTRSAGKFTPVHDARWEAANAAHGERDGPRALIEVLLMGRHVSHEHLVAGHASALRAGALTADAVALEARRAAEADEVADLVPAKPDRTNVTSLTERRLAQLPPDTRPPPSVGLRPAAASTAACRPPRHDPPEHDRYGGCSPVTSRCAG
ncbi:hypothetical protein RM704_23185 [Streptomyces sp. DSM 3412]|uniref:Transposase for insertion sequence element IS21-like C-terminal domain-containing protein n=1 Tax=Streptomyces gottesmaniae TaxID=3075518 RepID=A0ABU2Z174_9ACTN|nr:hypothetical protein [Streptomyces sp. DSM 3412]MDT0570337.1 hypothetical protein [Streptomyces sp. DSM 3412]